MSSAESAAAASTPVLTLEERRAKLFQMLEENGIKTETKFHPNAHSVEDWRPHVERLFLSENSNHRDYRMCKNLFMREKKKGSLWLVIASVNTTVDIKALAKKYGFNQGNLRLAADDLLEGILGVKPGSVTPFALFDNFDPARTSTVTVLVDDALSKPSNAANGGNEATASEAEAEEHMLLFHPLYNDATTSIRYSDFVRFLEKCVGKQRIQYIDFTSL